MQLRVTLTCIGALSIAISSTQLSAQDEAWRVFYSGAEVDEAVTHSSRHIARFPDQARWYVERGNAYFYKEEFAKAVADFDRALELDDTADLAYFGRGMALARGGDITAGIAALDVYLARRPASSVAYTKRGIRYLWLGDNDRAERDFLRALELDDGNAEARDDLGVIAAQRGDYTRAITLFKQVINLDPGYQKAFHNLALVYYLTDRNDLALKVVDDALELDPSNRGTVLLKAEILQALGNRLEADRLRQLAVELQDNGWSERAPLR